MLRRGVAYGVLGLLGLGLAGCGIRGEQREPWRTQAEEACLSAKLVTPSAYMSRSSPIEGPGPCGISHPFRIAAFGGGTVGVSRQVTLGCPMIPKIEAWIDDTLQPAAALYFGQPVVEMKSGTYNCRSRNNQRGARLSEHSFGNAIDISAFILADGREITVMRGWRGAAVEQEFLREVFVGACRHFTTVLGPGADMFHYDHFHLDLARHDARGARRVCKPVLKFTPRLAEGASASMSHGRFQPPPDWSAPGPRPRPAPGWSQEPLPESDIREEEPDGEGFGPISRASDPPFGARPAAPPLAAPAPLATASRPPPVFDPYGRPGPPAVRPPHVAAPAHAPPQIGVGVPLY